MHSSSPVPKDPPYRNQKLRDLAKECPHCMFPGCGGSDGTIVGCHSNSISDGHGAGQKASDLCAYGCKKCHDRTDKNWKEPGVREDFYHAVYYSTLWLLKEGHLVVR